MKIETRYFGEIDIQEEKIIRFEQGIFGFEDYKEYTVLYDIESEEEPLFSWLQSTTEKGLAFPIVNPFRIREDYNPVVEDAILNGLGEYKDEDLAIFLLATVPGDVRKASVNMKAPLIVNTNNRKGMQVIVENEDYEIRHIIKKEE